MEGEHRSAPTNPEVVNLQYYGGAEGNVLVFHPTLGLAAAPGPNIKNTGLRDEYVNHREDQEGGSGGGDGGGGGGGGGGGDGGDSVSVQLPPPGASVAEVRPVGLSIAGIGGVAASKPTGTAVVGPGGLAIARPVATAIAGVPAETVLGPGPGPEGPGQHGPSYGDHGYQLVGPNKQEGNKYGLAASARSFQDSPIRYVRIQPQQVFNSIPHSSQPVYIYPVAYY